MRSTRPPITQRRTPTMMMMKSTPDLQEQIRRRAYKLYEQRGRGDGHDLADWLQAESELTQQKAKGIGA